VVSRTNSDNPRKDLVLQALLDQSAELFIQRGYANTRMQDIADSLNMSRSSLYHYFDNKEEVLVALVEGDVMIATDALEELLKDPAISYADKLRRWIAHNINEKLSGGMRFRLVDRVQDDLPAEYRSLFRQKQRRVLELVTRVIEGGVRAGEFRSTDPKVTAFAVIGMSNWVAWWYSPHKTNSPDEIAGCMIEMVLRGLLNTPIPDRTRPQLDMALSQIKNAANALESLIDKRGE